MTTLVLILTPGIKAGEDASLRARSGERIGIHDAAPPRTLHGRPRANGVATVASAPPFRGAEDFGFLYGQSVIMDDVGVGPNQLLAIAASCRYGVAAADDFMLDRDALITGVSWEGVYFGAANNNPGPDHAVRITIYSDDGAGNVGALLWDSASVEIVKIPHPRPPIFGAHPVYTFHAELDGPFAARSGERYWLSINVDPTGQADGIAFGWMASAEGNAADTPENDQPLHAEGVDCDSLPATSFVPGGSLSLNSDLAFGLYGGCPPDDCDCDGIPDHVAIAQGLDTDCNQSGRPDQCDIDSGFSTDCNNNGIPDECELVTDFYAATDPMGPIGSGISQSFVIAGAPVAIGDVTLTIAARADLGSTRRFLNVQLNGDHFGRVFVNGGSFCPATPNVEQISIPPSVFNALTARGPVTVTLAPASPVSAVACSDSSVTAWIQYTLADSNDCNGSGALDACDILSGYSTDCSGTGVPDECEVAILTIEHGASLGQIGHDVPQVQMLHNVPDAIDDVDIVVIARGNFGSVSQWIDVYLNNVHAGRLFEQGGQNCQAPEIGVVTVSAALFNDLKSGNDVEIKLVASPQVSANLCGASGFVAVSAQYMGVNPEMGNLCHVPGDINGDGIVNSLDLAILLGTWGTNYPPADLNGNGVVDSGDLAILLSLMSG